MPRIVLTDLTITKLKSATQTRYWDASLPAFGILVGRRTKTFIVMRGKDRKMQTLGQYPNVALKQARKAALGLLSAEPATPDAVTVADAVLRYLEAHTGSPGWIREQQRLLTSHLLRKHTARALASITTAEVLVITDALAPTPSEQIHAHRAIKALFNWALQRRLVSATPLAGLPLPAKPKTRSRVLELDELKAIWQACDGAFGTIVRLLMLTGQRRGEVSKLDPTWLHDDLLTFPEHITKNRREHTVPLSDQAQSLAALAPFRFNAWSKSKAALDKRCGVTDWTLHDLRRTYSTTLASLQVEPHIIERILNHASGTISGVSATYNRYKYQDEMRRAVQLHAEYIAKNVTCLL